MRSSEFQFLVNTENCTETLLFHKKGHFRQIPTLFYLLIVKREEHYGVPLFTSKELLNGDLHILVPYKNFTSMFLVIFTE